MSQGIVAGGDPDALLDELIAGGYMMVGNPEEVSEQLEAYKTVGCDQLVFGLPQDLHHDEILELLELFGDKVIPEHDPDRVHSTDRYRATAKPKYAVSTNRCPTSSGRRSSGHRDRARLNPRRPSWPQTQRLNELLRPIAQPRVLEGVYTDDQHERMLEVIKRNGPWPTITAHHFDTVEELMATSNGGEVDKSGLTLDDIATAHFRGIFGEGSIVPLPGARGLLLQQPVPRSGARLLGCPVRPADDDAVQPVRPAPQRAERPSRRGHLPRRPHRELAGVVAERDGQSGLFTEHLVKMAQVITWWYLGENGTFTYWPDGPLGEPHGSSTRCGTRVSSCRTR